MYVKFVKIRSVILVFLTHHMALPFIKFIRKPQKFNYSIGTLSEMKTGTLGNDLYHFLTLRKLELLPYYAKHDIKHILFDYDTTDEGEVCLQCFMLGNGHISFPVAATVLYGILTMPEYYKSFGIAYNRGKNCNSLKNWDWINLIDQNSFELKDKLQYF